MIEQVVRETTAAIASINYYGVGHPIYAENLDMRIEVPAGSKYPMFWLTDIKTLSNGKLDNLTRYTCFAFLVGQPLDDKPDTLEQMYSYTNYLSKQWEVALGNHPAVLHLPDWLCQLPNRKDSIM